MSSGGDRRSRCGNGRGAARFPGFGCWTVEVEEVANGGTVEMGGSCAIRWSNSTLDGFSFKRSWSNRGTGGSFLLSLRGCGFLGNINGSIGVEMDFMAGFWASSGTGAAFVGVTIVLEDHLVFLNQCAGASLALVICSFLSTWLRKSPS